MPEKNLSSSGHRFNRGSTVLFTQLHSKPKSELSRETDKVTTGVLTEEL